MGSVRRIPVVDVVHPQEVLNDLGFLQCDSPELILGLELPQCGELLLHRWQILVLQSDHERPLVLAADIENRSGGVLAGQRQRNGQAREAGVQALGESVERLELAILLGEVLTRIFDEFAYDGEAESVGRHQLQNS